LCGSEDEKDLEKEYGDCVKAVRLLPFLSQMQYAYSAADLVVSRAGATTIAELMAYRIPAVLVPYPYAYNHQDANARFLCEAGCAALVPDSGLDTPELLQALEAAGKDDAALEAMAGSYNRLTSEKPASLVQGAIRIHRNG
jgi:UDP-N-acetylglucosamine--N-acetylmuramyl-(pentapeptide) pyrophosphoryl-undecaprenol N-acetylglucosamine transferase